MNNPTFTINLDENKQIEFNLNGGARGLQGIQGIAGVSPIVTLDKQGSNLTITVTDAEGTKSETITPGDMFKSTYDTNNNGRVDNADRVNNHTVEKDVPSNAVFTDTVYDDTEVRSNIVILTNTKADKTDTYTKSDVNELISDYSLITETGNKINLEINGSTYVLTAKLYDKNNNLISTSTGIDLPLETMVVGASYDSATKEIVLTLKNGETTRFSVADLVDGLVSTDTLTQTLEDYVKNTDYATSSTGGVIRVTNFQGADITSGGAISSVVRTYEQYNNSTTTAGTSFISKGTLENVITGKGLVSNTDYANTSTGGVILTSATYGLGIYNGKIYPITKTYAQYDSYSNDGFISKGTLENVLTARIGDISNAIDLINGESI